ncbi:hypothetical protein OG756_37785 [Streptomyces sp. NBC_01310]|uniref:hypothetical protein n=1 Tax=Streptomyces sp. NBC_01310 TaxID=2903820 RepID=UPI0035B603F9|nr:hypothetical protein OG756_37785 [Streptomyces sp. NBC_01310]
MRSGTEGERGERGEQEQPLYPGEATSGLTGDTRAEEPAESLVAESTERDDEPLLGTAETEEYRKAWSEIQGRFVDDPQEAVRSADTLVAEVMQALAGTFSERKQGLEGQWGRGEQVATEDLRVSLQHYRSFFNRLLNT